MIYLLSFLTVLLLILIYIIEKDVISPSFIFCFVFMIDISFFFRHVKSSISGYDP